jgi:hypothetical protein
MVATPPKHFSYFEHLLNSINIPVGLASLQLSKYDYNMHSWDPVTKNKAIYQ